MAALHHGTGTDRKKAAGLLEKAVSKKYPKALFVRGDMMRSEGREEEALELFLSGAEAAEQRCIDAPVPAGHPVPEYRGRK